MDVAFLNVMYYIHMKGRDNLKPKQTKKNSLKLKQIY
jgi:hypothetical protein